MKVGDLVKAKHIPYTSDGKITETIGVLMEKVDPTRWKVFWSKGLSYATHRKSGAITMEFEYELEVIK